MAPNFSAGAYPPGKTAKALPTRGEGWPSVLRAYKTPIFAKGPKANALPCPRGKARGTGDTTTPHSLTPAPAFEGRGSTHHLHSTPARPADPNPYTRYLVLLSMRSRVLMTLLWRRQENTALLSNCGLTGTSQHVSLLGLGGKGCSCYVHSADVDGVEVPSLLLPQSQSVDCVISAPV